MIPLKEIQRQKEIAAMVPRDSEFHGWAFKTIVLCDEIEQLHAEIERLRYDTGLDYEKH